MSVYVDKLRPVTPTKQWRWPKSAHMIADTIDELHEFASSIGLRREWFQPASFPHYDLTPARHFEALRRGALLVDRRELVAKIRTLRSKTQ